MRAVLIVLVALAGVAHADKRVDDIAAGYDKEAKSCGVHEAGLAKTLAGAATLHDDAIADDVKTLTAAHDVVVAYCDALAAAIATCRADPKASYKSLEKQLDAHDNKIRPLRKQAQQAFDRTGPVIARLIPKINAARVGAPDKEPVATKVTFPSGHTITLPAMPGTWKVSGTKARWEDIAEYSEGGATAQVSVRVFENETCDDEKKGVAKRGDAGATIESEEPKGERGPGVLAWLAGAVWRASYKQVGERVVQVECVPAKSGGVLVTVDRAAKLERDLSDVAAQMLGAVR